jgi:hypothetical protein
MPTTAKTSSSAKAGKTTGAAPKKVPTAAAKTKKAAAPPAPAAKKATSPKEAAVKRRGAATKVDPKLRQHYIEVAAYYIAERRGFLGGCANEDWVQAEVEIDQLLADKKLSA